MELKMIFYTVAAMLILADTGLVFVLFFSGRKMRGELDEIRENVTSILILMRTVAEDSARTDAIVEKLLEQKELDVTPDSEAARRAKEEIDRWNAGIANILSFGTGEKDGDRK